MVRGKGGGVGEVGGIQIVAVKINTLVKFQLVKFLGPDCVRRAQDHLGIDRRIDHRCQSI